MSEAVVGVLSSLLTGLFLYLGNRFVARQTREVGDRQVEVEQRKVDQEAFDRFIARYEADRNRQEQELIETRDQLKTNNRILGVALRHINQLRTAMRSDSPVIPPLPHELEEVAWSLLDSSE